MGRRRRHDAEGAWHHVMNRGVDRQPIFFGDADRVEFGRLLGAMYDDDGVEIHAYCLMSNHYHLLVNTPEGGLSAAMHRFSSVFVRHLNDRVGRDGPLFRGRFVSRSMTDEPDIANVVRYIHRNPLAISGVDSPASYRWSSHRTYLGARRRPHWMRTDTVMRWFGDDPDEFGRFVEFDTAPSDSDAVLRADRFIEAIELLVAERSAARPGRRRSEARCIALLTADRLPPTDRDAMHQALGLSNPGALRTARSRAARLAEGRPDVIEVQRVASQLAHLPAIDVTSGAGVTSGAWHQM